MKGYGLIITVLFLGALQVLLDVLVPAEDITNGLRPAYARAAETDAACPPDRPNRRRVVDMVGTITCTASVYRVLVCPKAAAPAAAAECYYTNENTCTAPAATTVCLSDQELRDAQAR